MFYVAQRYKTQTVLVKSKHNRGWNTMVTSLAFYSSSDALRRFTVKTKVTILNMQIQYKIEINQVF